MILRILVVGLKAGLTLSKAIYDEVGSQHVVIEADSWRSLYIKQRYSAHISCGPENIDTSSNRSLTGRACISSLCSVIQLGNLCDVTAACTSNDLAASTSASSRVTIHEARLGFRAEGGRLGEPEVRGESRGHAHAVARGRFT